MCSMFDIYSNMNILRISCVLLYFLEWWEQSRWLINLGRWWRTRGLFFPYRWATRSRWIFSSFATETAIRESKERRCVALESGKHSIVIKLNLILKSITEIADVLDMCEHGSMRSWKVLASSCWQEVSMRSSSASAPTQSSSSDRVSPSSPATGSSGTGIVVMSGGYKTRGISNWWIQNGVVRLQLTSRKKVGVIVCTLCTRCLQTKNRLLTKCGPSDADLGDISGWGVLWSGYWLRALFWNLFEQQ
jgi:hypothetical protein